MAENPKLSIIVVTANEEDWIGNCLRSVAGLDAETIIVDQGSSDKTVKICEGFGARVFHHDWQGFAAQKNFALTKASGEWIFFIDADERVSKELIKEIKEIISDGKESAFDAYAVSRQNILLGKEMRHGGWWPDPVVRLAKKDAISGWEGDLHEELKVRGEQGNLQGCLYHLSHRGITWMLEKSIKYTEIEARLRLEAGHPKMAWWRFLRVMFGEFWYRLIVKAGWRDGMVGWIEAISQAYNMFLVYVHLWEKQKGKSMEQLYQEIDTNLAKNGF